MKATFVLCGMGRAHRRLPFLVGCGASVFIALQTLVFAATGSSTATSGSQAPENGRFNVKEYGAVGDGVTNDTEAFNKALAACAVAGGTCYVPEGKYLISASGISTAPHRASVLSNVHLVGAGHRRQWYERSLEQLAEVFGGGLAGADIDRAKRHGHAAAGF